MKLPVRESDVDPDETLAARPTTDSPGDHGSASGLPPTPEAEVLAGRYRLLGLLGRGGMGSVYRARDLLLDEVIALKMLKRELADEPEMLSRFRQEVKLARRVTHPNVARTFDIGEHQSRAFLTMEYVDGESLEHQLARVGSLPSARVVEVGVALCEALAAAHASGVIHRDLKPGNVLVAKDGRVIVTDFGIARALADERSGVTAGTIVGTPTYMSPEQVEAIPDIDHRADLYALGAMLFELLTGRAAWQSPSVLLTAAMRLANPPPDPREHRPTVPAALAELVMALMARDRDRRPASAADTRAALEQAGRGADATPSTWPTSSLRSAPTLSPAPVVSPRRQGEKTVAVLPLRCGGSPDDDYLVDGLTEDLIDTLSMTRGLRLRPRGVVMAYKGRDGDAREFGRELGVDVVVEGSVRRAGPSYRIAVRLISVSDGFQLWATRLDRPLNELLVVVDELASAVADALTESVEGRGRQAQSNPQAVELYLRARLALRDSWHSSSGSARAADLFAQALALSPNDPLLLGGAAVARVRAIYWGNVSRDAAAAVVADARADARRAIAIDPRVGDAWLALAMIDVYQGRAHEAIHPLARALTAAPQFAKAHELLGRVLLEGGLVEEAARFLAAALELDPETVEPRWDLARAMAFLGDWQRVDALLAPAVTGPSPRMLRLAVLARHYLWRRAVGYDAPFAYDDVVEDHAGPGAVVDAVWVIARTGVLPDDTRARARDFAASRESIPRVRQFTNQIYAECLLAVGEADAAFDALTVAVDCGLADIAWAERCPLLDPWRAEPRWVPLLGRIVARGRSVLEVWRATPEAQALVSVSRSLRAAS